MYTQTNRFSRSFKLAGIHALALIGYFILFYLLLELFVTNYDLFLILVFLVGPLYFVSAFLSSYIYTISRSEHFASRIGFFSALKIGISLNLNLIGYAALGFIIALILALISFDLSFLFLVAIYFLFPLTSFYYILEWTLENKDNPYLSQERNIKYLPRQTIHPNMGSTSQPPIQNQSYQQPQFPPQQQHPQYPPPQYQPSQYQQSSQQQQFPTPPQYIRQDLPPQNDNRIEPQTTGENEIGVQGIFCSNCGQQNSHGSKFCKSCGISIEV